MPVVSNDKDLERYKEFVRKSPYGTFTQDVNWSRVKNNWTSDFVYVEENGHIVAAMSVIGIKNENGKVFLYAPRGPVCDFYDYKLVDKLIKEAEVLKEKYDAFLLRLDPEVLFDERLVQVYRRLGYNFRSIKEPIRSFTQPRYNMVLDIKDKTEDEIFKGFSSKGRYNTRKSIKSNIKTVKENSKESLDNFYELTKIMAQRQKINHRPKEYFKRLIDNMGGEIFYSHLDGLILSSSILIPYNKKFTYLYAASSNEKRNLMPNYNMVWTEIKYAIENNFDYFDFGGVFSLHKDDGLYRFKESFCYPDVYTAYIGELDIVYDESKYKEFLNK